MVNTTDYRAGKAIPRYNAPGNSQRAGPQFGARISSIQDRLANRPNMDQGRRSFLEAALSRMQGGQRPGTYSPGGGSSGMRGGMHPSMTPQGQPGGMSVAGFGTASGPIPLAQLRPPLSPGMHPSMTPVSQPGPTAGMGFGPSVANVLQQMNLPGRPMPAAAAAPAPIGNGWGSMPGSFAPGQQPAPNPRAFLPQIMQRFR